MEYDSTNYLELKGITEYIVILITPVTRSGRDKRGVIL